MNKRSVVQTVLSGGKPPYVPWSYRFTQEPKEALCAHYGCEPGDLIAHTGCHILELGSDIGMLLVEIFSRSTPDSCPGLAFRRLDECQDVFHRDIALDGVRRRKDVSPRAAHLQEAFGFLAHGGGVLPRAVQATTEKRL